MRKKINIIFLSLCFIAAIVAEIYFIRMEGNNVFSVAGTGIVILITGYLLLDSIRNKMKQITKGIQFYLDQYFQETKSRQDERYTEVSSLWKATYTATKKNSAMLSEQYEELFRKMDRLEENTAKELQNITSLLIKSLEGQKNSLNYEIHHNKENTKYLIKAIREDKNRTENMELLEKLLSSAERSNELLEAQIEGINQMKQLLLEPTKPVVTENIVKEPETLPGIEILEDENETAPQSKELVDEPEILIEGHALEGVEVNQSGDNPEQKDSVSVPDLQDDNQVQADSSTITPIYDDPNKNLSADEIASLFASFGQ